MDLFSSRGPRSTHESDDTAFHYSPAHGPEDVVYGGSDTEETEDEIRRKRKRYEDHARIYLDGHLPVLQSTSLRGPLNKESGWVNPWRYQAPKNRGWWRPGSKEMLFTKSNVLKRAADHGLEHLSPADALSWCKSTAEAEAESIAGNGVKDMESGSSSMEDDDSEEETRHSEHGELSHKAGTIARDFATPYAFKKDEAEDGTRRNRYTEEVTQGIKRPIDSDWLKGSYVSKRARWDGPTISTPTPIPDIHGRRRLQTQSRLVDIGNSQQPSVSHPECFPQAISPGNSMARKTSHTSVQNADYMPGASSKQRDPSMRSSFTPDAQRVAWDMSQSTTRLHEVSDIDKFQDTPTIRLGPHSRQESQKGVTLSRPYTNLELELSATKSTSSPMLHKQTPTAYGKSPDAISSVSFPDTLPKLLPDDGKALFERQGSASSEEEVSFVTEVAPSSRNLEEFQYRKKRTKVQHITAAADLLNHDAPASLIVSMAEPATQDLENQADIEPASAHELNELVFSPQPKDETITSSPNHKSSSPSRSEFASYYDERDISLLQTPHVPYVLNDPPLLPELATFASPFFQGGLGLDSPEPGKIPPNLQRSSYPAARSSQVLPSQTLPALLTATPKSPVNVHASYGSSKAVKPCDSSTQSYNTTPLRSGKSTGSSQIHKTQTQILEEVADIPTEKPLVDSDPRIGRIGDCPGVGDLKKLDDEVQVDAALNQQALDQQLQIRPVLGPQLQSEVALLDDHSADAASFEEFRAEELAVKVVPHNHDHEAIRDEDSKVPSQDDVVGNENYRESSLDEETDGEDLESQPNPDSENDLQNDLEYSSEDSLGASSPKAAQDISSVGAAEKEATPQVRVSSDLSQERSTQSEDDDFKVMGSIRPKNDSPKTPKTASQVLGPGEQSPWASVKIEPISKSVFMERDNLGEDDAASTSSYDDIILHLEEDDPPSIDSHDEDSSWQHIERSPTPDGEGITPFKDIIVPPSPTSRSHSPEDLPSTQLLFEAALKNPWDSNSKTKDSEKSRKRVSFGMLLIDRNRGKENPLAESSSNPKRVPRSPPPQEPMELLDEDSSDDTTMVISFGDHFSTSGRHRLIPERNSQLNSSPAVGAQAQAFIAADREVSEKQEDHKTLPMEPSRHLQPRNEAMDNSVWQDSVREDNPFENSSFISSKGLMDPFAAPTFDMEDVLGKAGDFLEDWSVDAEIKKGKEMSSSKDIESNGAKRRKLFGIM